MPDTSFDSAKRAEYGIVCGTDEAGRGPLCGPVVAAAVVLPDDSTSDELTRAGLNDSKKLSEKKREQLYDLILEKASAYGIAEASPEEIDAYNILAASLLAMRRAVESVRETVCPGIVLADGNRLTDFGVPAEAVVHGDALSPSIAAASVLAKVTRDRIMTALAEEYPGYGLERHKGYPTWEHKLAVFERGAAPIYRRTFLGFLERDREKLEAALRKKKEEAE